MLSKKWKVESEKFGGTAKVAAKDTILDELLTLVQEGTVERRCAALLVFGALQRQKEAKRNGT